MRDDPNARTVTNGAGRAGGRHLAGLGQRNAIAHATPIGVFLNLAAHAVGENRDAFGLPQGREQGFIALHGWIKRLDERAETVGGSPVAGPAVARRRKPAIELYAIVPIGNRHDVRETGFVDIPRPVPMRWATIGFETGSDPCRRLRRGFRRRIRRLDAEIGHHYPLHAWLVARHERRVGRRIIVGDAPVTGTGAPEMLWDRGFHGGLLLKSNHQA